MFRWLLLFVGLFAGSLHAQQESYSFLKPSDTLHIPRRNAVVITTAGLGATALVGLHQLWYKGYPQSQFHFINDNNEWLQMDKAGHVFSCYHLSRLGAESFRWAGMTTKSQLLYGSASALAFMTAVEVFDGFSAEWGASWGDIIANTSGTALYVGQELLWKEQRIVPKFSFQQTHFAPQRPTILGSSFQEQLLKDYNGQTYWLSFTLADFFKSSKIPPWLCIALGYGADGMLAGRSESKAFLAGGNDTRQRQFYLSLDINLTKIRTNNRLLKTLFSVFNVVKIPAPTLEYQASGKWIGHWIYF
ncbi:DUF2279 domain-containing protein [Flavobacterium sp.]|jgi:hypothetical protein|uniref:DUF2279 domain-containing protein n=1 Tax=Flavobacterium sp. TaxID=239 RepID=UPI0022CAEF43|nr:DUF2279 domain-containing protein [Flavobacterium sp.]MCZ8144916.1 DUF2279 domain-containing protein [Flavobacterium sp.]MCZ8366003.1 DUF2279 domain-containing protein [Flavobacterium sp.]